MLIKWLYDSASRNIPFIVKYSVFNEPRVLPRVISEAHVFPKLNIEILSLI